MIFVGEEKEELLPDLGQDQDRVPEPPPATPHNGLDLDTVAKYTTVVSCVLTSLAVVIAVIGIFLAKSSLDKTSESLKMTREGLDVTKQAFQFEVLQYKPEFCYKLTATICPNNPENNDFYAEIEMVKGIPVQEVSIEIKAGVIDTPRHELVFNHWKKIMQSKDKIVFDKSDLYFMERMNKNLRAIDPNIFVQKKLNLLKLYAKYCVNLGDRNVLYDDDTIGISRQINPEYK